MTDWEARHTTIRVGVAVVNGEHILLTEHQRGDEKYFMLPGGTVNWWEPIPEATLRHCAEEGGVDVTLNEVIVIAETRNREQETHTLHLIFDTAAWGGSAAAGENADADDVVWYPVARLTEINLHPPVGSQLIIALQGLTHGVRLVPDS